MDYGLFIISRYRSAVKEGMSYADAASLAVATSGRTVLFAGLTVCIALLGQFLLGVSFLYGVSVAAAIAVALTMATAITFLPAMLGFLGPRVLSRRERAGQASGRHASPAPRGFWLGWARFVEARKILVALASLCAVVAIALPITGLRLGTSDASTDPAGWTTHQAYTALAQGFGPGFAGPLELAAESGTPRDVTAFVIFSVLFGLSMDYEVYLVSRIQEEWHHGKGATAAGRNHLAVTTGQARSGPVIAAAAGIMILVFGSFMFGARELAEFGFGLGFSVLVGALLIRSLLVPALMHLSGSANWALPGWLDRILPRLAVERALHRRQLSHAQPRDADADADAASIRIAVHK